MNRHGLRTRILIFSILPIIIIGVGLAAFFSYSNYSKLNEKLINNGRSIIYPLSTNISFAMTQKNLPLLQGLINEAHQNNSRLILAISIFDSNNNMLVTSSITPETSFFKLNTNENEYINLRDSEQYLPDGIIIRMPIYAYDEASLLTLYGNENNLDIHKARINNKDILFADPKINYPRQIVGYVCIYLQNNQIILDIYGDITITAILVFLGVLFSLLFGINLNRIVVDPINKLSLAIYEIREGNVNTKVNGIMYGELEKLRTYINAMANTMSEYHNSMQYNVDLATNDLRNTQEQLHNQTKELDLAVEKAENASKIKSEFLANMSHELRTPLNGIIGFAKQLYKSNLTNNQLNFLQPIEKSATNLLNIVNNILDFSKLDAGKLTFEEMPFSLREICYDTINLLSNNANDKGLELSTKIDKKVHDYFLGDPLRIGQILTNILGNAIKFTQKGNVSLEITALNNNKNSNNNKNLYCLQFTIRDTGIGINKEQAKFLFNPFTQADSSISRRYGGTGLGLVITKKLIEQMNGSINFVSEPGQGTTFTFNITLNKGKTQLSNLSTTNILSSKKIAIIESNTWVRDALKTTLEYWNLYITSMSMLSFFKSLHSSDIPQYIIYGIKSDFDYNFLYAEFSELKLENVERIIIAVNTFDEKIHDKLRQLSPKVIVISKPINPNILYDALTKEITFVVHETTSINTNNDFEKTSDLKKNTITQISNKKNKLIEASILAVDDNNTNLMLIKTLLSEIVTNIYTATNGEEAIEMCLHTEFDIILMDIQMPIMDGVTATKSIRKNGVNKQTPIIAVTALVIPEEKEKFLKEGMDEYLEKPLDENQLRNIICKYCNKITQQQKIITENQVPTTVQTITQSSSLWNINEALKVSGNKADLAKEMLTMFIKSVPNFSAILNNFADMEPKEFAKEVHKFAGGSVYCGIKVIKTLCNSIEKNCKNNLPLDEVEPEILELQDTIERVLKEYKNWIKELNKLIKNK
ncbi:MAG: two-component sensor histidine kinase BarA [Succinivibrionaceae bacterium]